MIGGLIERNAQRWQPHYGPHRGVCGCTWRGAWYQQAGQARRQRTRHRRKHRRAA